MVAEYLMALSSGLFIFCLSIIPGLASPLQAFTFNSPDVPQLLSINNLTTISQLNVSSSDDDLVIQCSGEDFGVNPNIVDCEEAVGFISRDDHEYPWAPRHTGFGPDVLPLPFRIMGDRALCFFEGTLIRSEAGIAHASLHQFRLAASALISKCAKGGKSESWGGIAKNIGGDNNLAVTLSVYRPAVRCRGAFGPEWSSCRDILGDMPAGKGRMIFGPRSWPGPRQELPMSIESSDDKCLARILTTGKADFSSWYNLWEAVTAVYSVCVRLGQGGVYRGLGDAGNIFLTMTSTAEGTAAGAHLSSLPINVSMDTTELMAS